MIKLRKPLRVFTSELEARLAQGHLEALGFFSEVRGSKEYATHITGGFNGRYELHVNQEDMAQAEDALKSIGDEKNFLRIVDETHPDEDEGLPPGTLAKRALYLALVGVIVIPVLPHLISLYFVRQYLKVAPLKDHWIKLTFATLISVLGLVAASWFVASKLGLMERVG